MDPANLQPLKHSLQRQTPGFESWYPESKNVINYPVCVLLPQWCKVKDNNPVSPCKKSETKGFTAVFRESYCYLRAPGISLHFHRRGSEGQSQLPTVILSLVGEGTNIRIQVCLIDTSAQLCCPCRSLKGYLEHRISAQWKFLSSSDLPVTGGMQVEAG